MKDRLHELKVRYRVIGDANEKVNKGEHVKILDNFLEKVENVTKIVDEIDKNIELMKSYQLQILSSSNNDQSASNHLDKCMRTIASSAVQARNGLSSIEDDCKCDNLLPTTGIHRIKTSQHSTILKRFVDVMTKYNNRQLEYRAKCKSRIRLQLEVAGTCVTEDKVEDMLDVSNPYVFTEAVMEQTESAKRSLIEIEARHADILKLERSIEEMKEMFSTMALLVNDQGDLIDNIEHNVQKTTDSVINATKQVQNAVVRKEKMKRWKIICTVIAVVLVILIIISLASILGLR